MASKETTPWWKDATVYQIYPASFKDSNGDGLGDIPGIISRIDYVAELGVDVVWLSPMYQSPQLDMGYDISDYEAVHAPYGTVADVEALVAACHARGLRLILDLVVNHTSDQHAWFRESRSSRDNPKRDWYIWRPARRAPDGSRLPPNNWRSFFSGSTWAWDEHTQEYYLHLFAAQQPDLNWESPAARRAIYASAMRFWLDRGVDGFRVDTVNMYSKGAEMPDAPVGDPAVFPQAAFHLFCNGPRMHDFLREMHAEVLARYDAMTVGELPFTPDPAHVLRYVSARDRQLDMVFQFDMVDLGHGPQYKYDLRPFGLPAVKAALGRWQEFVAGTDGWTTAFCENHDQGRSVSRFADDSPAWRERSAKLLAAMMASLTGTLFVYQGQEIGMVNAPREWPIDEYKDIEALNYYDEVRRRTGGKDEAALAEVLRCLQILGRDHARLPMQWDGSANAGFSADVEPEPSGHAAAGERDTATTTTTTTTTMEKKKAAAEPWMRVHDLYPEINVAAQQQSPTSVLAFWKAMLRLRREHRHVFVHGDFRSLDAELGDDDNGEARCKLFFYEKKDASRVKPVADAGASRARAVVGLNFSADERRYPDAVFGGGAGEKKLLVSSYNLEHDEAPREGFLRPWEGRVWLV